MAQFHFVEDYEKLIERLVSEHPIDEAMAIAVGGSYEGVGRVECDLLLYAGLKSQASLLDLGCGSGRLAHALGKSGLEVQYIGVDIIQCLLNYAATRAPKEYRFLMHRGFDIPVSDASINMVCAFSLFTHLLHHETYLYMQDSHRVLRHGGKLVFSFLEFAEPDHWHNFIVTAETTKTGMLPHLNAYIERSAIDVWASKLGYVVEEYIKSSQDIAGAGSLGQSTAILRRV